MTRYLAESTNYKVTSEYEYVTFHFKNRPSKKPVYLGDFYGDPDCAIISKDEKYVVAGGCGLIIYRLQEPFQEYGSDNHITNISNFLEIRQTYGGSKDLSRLLLIPIGTIFGLMQPIMTVNSLIG